MYVEKFYECSEPPPSWNRKGMDDEASTSFISPPGYGYYAASKSSYNNEEDSEKHSGAISQRLSLPPASELLSRNGHCGNGTVVCGGPPPPPDVRQYAQTQPNSLPSISLLGHKSQYYYQQSYPQPSPSIPPSPYLNTPSTYYSITEPGTPAPQIFSDGEPNGHEQNSQQPMPIAPPQVALPATSTTGSSPAVSPASTVSNQQRSPRAAGRLSSSTTYQQQQQPSLQNLNQVQQLGSSNRWIGGPIAGTRAPRASKGGGRIKTAALLSPMLQLQSTAPPAFGDDGPTVREHLQQQQARQRNLQSQTASGRTRRGKSASTSPQKSFISSQSSISGTVASSSRQPTVYSQGAPYAAAAPPPPSNGLPDSRRNSLENTPQSRASHKDGGSLDDTLASTIASVAAGEGGFNPETLLDPSPSNMDDELDEETTGGTVVAQRVPPPSSAGCSSTATGVSVSSDYVFVDNLLRSAPRKRQTESYVAPPYRAAPPVGAVADSRQQKQQVQQQNQQFQRHQQRQELPSQGDTIQVIRQSADAYNTQQFYRHQQQQLQSTIAGQPISSNHGANPLSQQNQQQQYRLQSPYPYPHAHLQPQPSPQRQFPIQQTQAWSAEYAQRQMIYAPQPQSSGHPQPQSVTNELEAQQRWPPVVGGHFIRPPPQYGQQQPHTQPAMHSPNIQTFHGTQYQQSVSQSFPQYPSTPGAGSAPSLYDASFINSTPDGQPAGVDDSVETRKYTIKLCRLKKEIKAMVYTNAALADEVARLHQRIEVVTQERYMLAKRLQHHQRNRIRRIQTKERRRAASRAKKSTVINESRVEKDVSTDATVSDADVATVSAAEGEGDVEETKPIRMKIADLTEINLKNCATPILSTPRNRRPTAVDTGASPSVTPILLSSALASAIGVPTSLPLAAPFSMSLRQRRDTSLGDSVSTLRPKSQNSLVDEDEMSDSCTGKDHRRRTTSLQQQQPQKRDNSKRLSDERPKSERQSARQRSQQPQPSRKRQVEEDTVRTAQKRRRTLSKSSSTNISPVVEKALSVQCTNELTAPPAAGLENGISPRTRSATRALSMTTKLETNTTEVISQVNKAPIRSEPVDKVSSKKRHSLEDSDEDGKVPPKEVAVEAEEENEALESDNDDDYRNEEDEADAADDDEEDWNEEKRCFTSLRRASVTKRRRRLFGDVFDQLAGGPTVTTNTVE